MLFFIITCNYIIIIKFNKQDDKIFNFIPSREISRPLSGVSIASDNHGGDDLYNEPTYFLEYAKSEINNGRGREVNE